MEFLSWLFFCLSPFALVCSEDGNGLLLCPTYIILGVVFRWLSNKNRSKPKVVVKIKPQEFWEWHYKDRMRSTLAQKGSINDNVMAYNDQEARRWATTVCGYNNMWVPPTETQEQIARANGVITEKMIKIRNENKDRIQIGKYFLMKELLTKYKDKDWFIIREIEDGMKKIKLSQCGGADDFWVRDKYGMTVREMWDISSYEEKTQARKWIREYEEKLIQAIQDYESRTVFFVRHIDIDF